jgi:hypothetical protein
MTKLNPSLNKYFSGLTLMILFIFGMTSVSIAQEHGTAHDETKTEEAGATAHEGHESKCRI